MAEVIKPIAEQEGNERQARVARAIASVRLDGLEPMDAAKAVFDRYVKGDLTTQEVEAEIQALNARELRPTGGAS